MDKRYQHQQFEKKIYQQWEKQGFFAPGEKKGQKPFCIIMPPPNANGALHIGHAMFVAVEDIIIRYQRMRGKATLWLPGADHASIATQVVFEKKLAEKEKTRFDLGREEFVRQCMEFTLKNKETMYNQLRLLAASCDWGREKFTLDKDVTKITYETFYQLFKDGLVYRDWRMVHWCPRCSTALSDLEVKYQEEKSKLWSIKYPFKKGKGFIVVATTRPETMLGDAAVAVNPKDKRYKGMVGQKLILPLMKREIPIIADPMVDQEFGTGAVKITPAHDPDDFAVGKKHQLAVINVIGFDNKMTQEAGDFKGLSPLQAREKILAQLRKEKLVGEEKDYQHRVGHCERCKTVVEPLVSLQWFIKMKPLAERAIRAVKKGETKIVPQRFEKTYFHWLKNIRDWCISRQLWWGHQLPIWYCGHQVLSPLQKGMNPELVKKSASGCGEVFVGEKPPEKCQKCGKSSWVRDPDIFDTWFSSGQWPYSVLGYPKGKDYQRFYPTSVMETGYDILFFWVARMMMLGLYRTKKVPFTTVYLHGMVRDVFGEPMSKSKPETCVDPTETIEKYGADALRMALIYGASAGNDVVVGEEKIRAMRNFTNKIWNAARFVELNLKMGKVAKFTSSKHKDDKAIIKEMKKAVKSVTADIEKYRFGQALETAYQFFWRQFCDLYLEQTKNRRKEATPTLLTVLLTSLKLLHPFAPFVTEAIYQNFKAKVKEKSYFAAPYLIIAPWPKEKEK